MCQQFHISVLFLVKVDNKKNCFKAKFKLQRYFNQTCKLNLNFFTIDLSDSIIYQVSAIRN